MSVAYNSKSVTDGLLACFDASNPKSYSPNVFPYPLDIASWYTSSTGNASTLARDTSTSPSPAGGIPFKMTITGSDPHIGTYNSGIWNFSSAVNGQTWCVSVYVKASVPTTSQIFLFGADINGSAWSGSQWYSITSKNINVTTEWTRQEHYLTLNYATDVNLIKNIQFRFDGPESGGEGQIIWWDGVQVELAQTASPFTSIVNQNSSNLKDLLSTYNATLYNYPAYNATSKSLTFDGSTDYLTIPNTNYPTNATDSFTIECWLNIPSSATWSDGTNRGSILTRGTYEGSIGLVRRATNNTISMWVRGATAGFVDANAVVNRDTWFQVVGTWDGVKSEAQIYINGQYVSNSIDATVNSPFESDNWSLGAIKGLASADGNRFQGNVSNIKIYNRELTADEIKQNFNALRGRYGI